MPVGPLAPDFCLHLGRSATVCPCDILLLAGLGLHLALFLLWTAFAAALEGDPAHDDGIDIIASVHIADGKVNQGGANRCPLAGVD